MHHCCSKPGKNINLKYIKCTLENLKIDFERQHGQVGKVALHHHRLLDHLPAEGGLTSALTGETRQSQTSTVNSQVHSVNPTPAPTLHIQGITPTCLQQDPNIEKHAPQAQK